MKLPTKKTYFKSEVISSIDMFRKTIQFADYVGRIIGCDIFSPQFSKFNPVLCVMYFDLITYLLIIFQNIYAFRDDFVRIAFCVVTLGFGFQCIVKLYTFVFNRKQVLLLVSLTESFHESASNKKALDRFETWNLMFCHVASVGAILFYGCSFILFCSPIVYYLFTWKRILHFGFIIPGIDWTTVDGYSLNFLHQTFQIYTVINALFLTTYCSIIFMFNAYAQFDSIQTLLETLDHLVENNQKHKNDANIKACIADITNGHVRLHEYEKSVLKSSLKINIIFSPTDF